jgi:hypothetical protein
MFRLLVGLFLFTSLCAAQTPDPLTNQKVLEELKVVRATLARVIEVLEKNHE